MPEAIDINVEYIKLSPEGSAGEEGVIMVEHDPDPSIEVPPPEVDQGKHQSMYTDYFCF